MFEIDEGNLPIVRTRQALIILDLQNDFTTGGILPVENPSDFLERIVKLCPEFRISGGTIIWIRSIFETSRVINDANVESENVVTDKELRPSQRDGGKHMAYGGKSLQKLLELRNKISEENDLDLDSSSLSAVKNDDHGSRETFLTLDPDQKPWAVQATSPGADFFPEAIAGMDGEKDLVFQKTYYSAFKDGSLVQTLRAKFVTEIYICGALTNISIFATAMDAARHGYAITLLEDCLGYRSKARHDEALRRLTELTGADIIKSPELIEDLRQKAKMRQTAPRKYVRPHKSRAKQPELENLMSGLSLKAETEALKSDPTPTGQSADVAVAVLEVADGESSLDRLGKSFNLQIPTRSSEGDGIKRERVKSKVKTRRRPSKSVTKEIETTRETDKSSRDSGALSPTTATLKAASQALEKLPKSPLTLATSSVNVSELTLENLSLNSESVEAEKIKEKMPTHVQPLQPGFAQKTENEGDVTKNGPDFICEGDTTVIRDLLDGGLAEGIFERIRDEVRWQKMSHRGGDVPRLIAIQGDIAEDGSMPIYRHPADESPPLRPFSQTVSLIRAEAEKRLGHSLNHVLIQFYRDGSDYISEHSDKTLDIVPNTFIANVSLGAQRTMVFRTKKQPKSNENSTSDPVLQRQACRAPLPHNSMCKMGLLTNMRWLHGIRQDKRLTSEKSEEELAYNGGRISLTFRKIGTFLDKDQQKIWGQGAVAKFKDNARTVINGNTADAEKMIQAFGKENHSSEFNWEGSYGEGFDVLHISNDRKLFLSSDGVADMRAKIILAEYGIEWTEGNISPAFNWKDGNSHEDAPAVPETFSVKLVDDDLSKSTITGDLAIMLYLDSVYGSKYDAEVKTQVDFARQFTRLQQSDDLLNKWRNKPFNVGPFRRELDVWEVFAAESSFIAGSKISLADYALWPILHEIVHEWPDLDGCKHLFAYYQRMKQRESVLKTLGSKDDLEAEKTS